MKKLIFIANDLEKTGKSSLALLLYRHMQDQDLDVALINTDYAAQDWLESGIFWDPDRLQDSSKLVKLLDTHEVVILDSASSCFNMLADFYEHNQLNELLEDIETELLVFIPSDGSEAAAEQIVEVVAAFGEGAKYILAKMPTQTDTKLIDKKQMEKTLSFFDWSEFQTPEIPSSCQDVADKMRLPMPLFIDAPEELRDEKAENDMRDWFESSKKALIKLNKILIPDGTAKILED